MNGFKCTSLISLRAGACIFSVLFLFWCAADAQMPAVVDIANGDTDVIIYGGTALDNLGTNSPGVSYGLLALGDFNGDGINDLAIGAQLADGPADGRADAGEVYVYLGSVGFSGVKDVAGTFGAAPDVTIYGATAGDRCGDGIHFGDVNGDNRDDLVFGAPEADGPAEGRTDAGEAYIVFGSASPPSQIDLASSEEDVTIYGATAGDTLVVDGAVGLGDLNDDGTLDVVVGTFLGDGPGDSGFNGGDAYVIYGSAMLPATVDLANGDEDVVIYGGGHLTRDGAIRFGDVNDDQITDLILGSPTGSGQLGEAFVVYGSAMLPATIDLFMGDGDVQFIGGTPFDNLTLDGGLEIGDISGDGIDDIVAGTWESEGIDDSVLQSGEARAVFGSSTLPAVIDGSSNEEDMVIYGADIGDSLTENRNIVIADFNGDSMGDLILGASGAAGFIGESYVIFGSSSLPSSIELFTESVDLTITGADAGDGLTASGALASGDFNGDGIADLILGATGGDGPMNARTSAGDAYVIFGSTTPPSTIDLSTDGQDVIIYGALGVRPGGGSELDAFLVGGPILVGDLNGDTLDDLILGAILADGPSDARPNAGEVYVIFGATTLFVYADFGVAPGGNGSLANPYSALSDAVAAVDSGGSVRIKGDVATTDSNENLTLSKPMTIEAIGGSVRIGL